MADTPVQQTLPFPVRIVRWFNSGVVWSYLWSLSEAVIPILLITDFGSLGFSAQTAGWVMLWLKVINVAIGIRATVATSTVVGNTADVAVSSIAPPPQPVQPPSP